MNRHIADEQQNIERKETTTIKNVWHSEREIAYSENICEMMGISPHVCCLNLVISSKKCKRTKQ